MILKLKRTPGIYLVGFMGCGKSTVGRALADDLGWSFVDLDEEIEKREQSSIADIFDNRGEEQFREAETAALREQVRGVERGQPRVVSLGGGAFLKEQNFAMVSGNGVSIWLHCSFDMIQQRVAGHTHRPLARDPERLRELYEKRQEGYGRADYKVEVESDDPAVTVAQIKALGLF